MQIIPFSQARSGDNRNTPWFIVSVFTFQKDTIQEIFFTKYLRSIIVVHVYPIVRTIAHF